MLAAYDEGDHVEFMDEEKEEKARHFARQVIG